MSDSSKLYLVDGSGYIFRAFYAVRPLSTSTGIPTNAVTGVIEPIVLPEQVKVLSVRTEHDFAPITAGKAYVYFFPQGRTQMTHVQLQDARGDRQWTIIVQPLTGRVKVLGELVDLELPDDMLEEEDELGETQNRRSF